MSEAAKAPLHKRAGQRLGRWWFADLPAERLAGLRILVGLFCWYYLWDRFHSLVNTSKLPVSNWRPIGVVSAFTDQPLDPATYKAIVYATQVFAIGFTLGVLHRFAAPVFAALLLFTLTYRNSWSMVFHTENLLVLHVAVLALAPAGDAWSIDRWWRKRRGAPPPEPSGTYAWAVRTAAVLTVITYVLAGIAKMRLSGMEWLDGHQLRNQIAFDNIRKAMIGDQVASLAVPLLEHPRLFIGLAIMTMMVELGAPIALLNTKVAAVWALAAWGFHVGVIALMQIHFPYPLSGVAYAPLFPVEKPMGWIARLFVPGMRKPPSPP